MEAVKLSDLMNTRYIIDDFKMKLIKALNKQRDSNPGTDTIIDLAGCKFGPLSASVIDDRAGEFVFINSADDKLDTLCKTNHEIALSKIEEYPILSVPEEFYGNELKDWITQTPTGKYKLKLSLTNYPQELAAVLFIMARPDCELDLTDYLYDLFTIIKNHVDFDGVEDVLLLEAPYCRRCKYSEVANTTATYIPYDIGTKKLLSFTENVKVPKRYMGVIKYCAENICERFKQEEQEQYYTDILDLLKFRGEQEDE